MGEPLAAGQPRVLWIAYVFPPAGGTQGLRMQRYLQEITRADPSLTIDVLTIRQSAANPQYDEMLGLGAIEGVRVHQVRPGWLHEMRYRWRLDQRSLPGGRARANAAVLSLIHLSNLGWIPWAATWIAVRGTVVRRRYDAVYVFVDPFASLLLAMIAAVLNPGARLVMEYGDPRIPVRRGRRSLLRAAAVLEERTLRRSAAAIFRTQAAIRAYQARYPSVSPERFAVLYGGVDWEPYDAPAPAPASPGAAEFTIAYTGTLYVDSVDPEPFFRAVARVAACGVEPVRVRMVGAESPVAVSLVRDLGLGEVVSFTGHVPASQVISMQRSATLLLAFGFQVPYKISSKIAQYFAARVPILFIGEAYDDPGAELVRRYRRGVNAPNEAGAIASAILDVHGSWQRGDLGRRFDLSRSGQYSWHQLGGQVRTLLTGSTGGRR
jgi:glycosyltransferase involved in cell wall biosynthesis